MTTYPMDAKPGRLTTAGQRTNWGAALALAALLVLPPLSSQAVTQDNFLVRTTADLVELCSASGTDEMHTAAIHFCQGYFVGADHYYLAERRGSSRAPPLICLSNPPPTRDQAIHMFVDWARTNPQFMSELPVDSVMRFAATTWPCRK
jgi:Ssp1 endopeptidase immunity protein Rap1a